MTTELKRADVTPSTYDPFTPRPEPPAVADERERRRDIWRSLIAQFPAGQGVPYSVMRDLAIWSGQMGIYFDKKRTTTDVTPHGMAVGLLWSTNYGEEATEEDRFVYSYPITARPGRRNANEIEAVKITRAFRMPVFLIDTVSHSKYRHVRLAWVVDWDDELKEFLLSFGNPEDAEPEVRDDDDPEFLLDKAEDDRRFSRARRRIGQNEFRFRVFQRYKRRCAFCSIRENAMLDAAHLKPTALIGADDPRNALVLCKSHHAALDAKLITINPATLAIEVNAKGVTLERLKIEYTSIEHLLKKPHAQALSWLYGERRRARSLKRAIKSRDVRVAVEPVPNS